MGKMKLLLIGGTGVLSSSVVNEAVKQGFDITIVNRGKKRNSIPQNVTLIKADYRNETLMKSKLQGMHFDTVIDFICYNPNQIEYSIKLLHHVADQYVFISTTCVYNTKIPGIKNEDSEKVLKEWDYSVNKWKCECYLQEQSKILGFNYTIVRPCITYDDTRIPYGIMPLYGYHWTLCSRILQGKPILRWNGGTTRWNMMRVEDFAVGLVGIIGKQEAYGEAYNICGDDFYTWNDVIGVLEDCLGKKAVLFDLKSEEYQEFYPNRKGEIIGRSLDSIVNNAKIKRIVPEFKTTYSLKDGLSKTIAAYRDQNYQLGIDWIYDAVTDRIVYLLLKRKGLDSQKYKLGFVDYLGSATANDKRIFWLEFHRYNVLVKTYLFVNRIINKIKLIIFK